MRSAMSHPWIRNTLVVLVLLAFGAYFLLVQEDTRSEGLQYVELGGPREPASSTSAPRVEIPPPYEQANPTDEPAAPSEFSIPSLRLIVRGRVVDSQGKPLAGIGVQREHAFLPDSRAESDSQGRFELAIEEPQGELSASGAGWILIGGERYLDPEREEDYLLVLAPAVEFRGRVVDARGVPVSDASLFAIPPGDALVRFGLVAPPMEHESQRGWSARDGAFRLGPVPFLPGGRIEVSAPGASPVEFPQPAEPSQPLQLVIGER